MDEEPIDPRLLSRIERATKAGEAAQRRNPRAIGVSYDAASGRVVVEMSSGASFAVPTRLIQGLGNASQDALTHIEISPSGFGLYWPELDVDMGVLELAAGIYGTKAWMAELRRQGALIGSQGRGD